MYIRDLIGVVVGLLPHVGALSCLHIVRRVYSLVRVCISTYVFIATARRTMYDLAERQLRGFFS